MSNLIPNPWLVIAFLLSLFVTPPVHSLQANTPQGALEEIATTNKPEILVRHLPETVQKSIESLSKPKQSEIMSQLMQMKKDHFDNCTIRRADGADTWEIIDEDGEHKGTVKLENAYVSGLDALLPLHINSADNSGTLIVTLHLEDDEWRIQDFGNWRKSDIGLTKLLHEPTEIEKNEEAAMQTLNRIRGAVQSYAQWHSGTGYPYNLPMLTRPVRSRFFQGTLLDESFAAEPLILDGYEFRYLRILGANGKNDSGSYQVLATPVEFGKTGVKSFLMSSDAGLRSTRENRPATADDPREGDDDTLVVVY